MHEAMKQLPEHCAEILDRFFARDESYRTIGEALDIPPGTIASRISRCLRKLRGQLEGRKPRFRRLMKTDDDEEMNFHHQYDEERLADLLQTLPPAPEGWVKAAQELPQRTPEIDEIAARAEADAEFRAAVDRRPRGRAGSRGLRRRSQPAARAAGTAHRLVAAVRRAVRGKRRPAKRPISTAATVTPRHTLPPWGRAGDAAEPNPPEAVFCMACGARLRGLARPTSASRLRSCSTTWPARPALGERLEPEAAAARDAALLRGRRARRASATAARSRSSSATPRWRSSASPIAARGPCAARGPRRASSCARSWRR